MVGRSVGMTPYSLFYSNLCPSGTIKEIPPLVFKGAAKGKRGTNFISPYLDEKRSKLDELGTVEKQRVVAFQR